MRRVLKPAFVVVVILVAGILVKGNIPQPASGNWLSGGSMSEPRSGASAALLQDGRILITGGDNGSGPATTAEFFDTTGAFVPAPPMNVARSNHVSVVLQDGRVLAAGGTVAGGGATNAVEIYDPIVNTWGSLSGGMIEARSGATATVLKDGRVLVVGGQNGSVVSSTIEVFDPVGGSFSFAGALFSPRTQHATAVLADGRVLIIGGSNGSVPLASSDIFDPIAGTVAPGPSLATPRSSHSATTLLDGRVLVAGGNNIVTNADGSTTPTNLASAEIFDPSAGTFSPATRTLATPRQGHLAFLLPHNNNVLIVGGISGGAAVSSAELFTPWQGSFSPTSSLSTARSNAAGMPMQQDGLLLVAGGKDAATPPNALASTEVYGFATVKTDKADYAPGEIVTITGSGWQPSETVTLSFLESPLIDTHPNLTAVADSSGNISNSQFSPDPHDFGILFYLTAVGQTSARQAQTTFTDNGNKSIFSDTDTTTETTTFGTIAANQCRSSFLVALQGANRATPPVANGGTATVSSTPAGATFFVGSGCTGSAVTSVTVASGLTSASFSFRIPVVGAYTVNGVGSWDSGGSSNHASASVTVNQGTSALSPAAATGTYGGTANLSATLTAGGAGVSGKTITFKLNGGTVGTGTTDPTGTATLSSASLTSPTKINATTFPTGVSASFAGDSSFTASSGTNTLTVNQKAITVTAATNSKGYDGATSATATPTITAGGPLVSGDSANFTEVYSDKNVGTGNKTLIPSGTVNDGNSGANYNVTFVNNTTGTITARAITVTATTNTKTYDGNTTAAATPAVTTGTIATGDTANFTEAYSTAAAGTNKTLVPSGTVTDSNGGANYNVSFVNFTTGTINKAPLTVSATGVNKQYDATTAATVTLSDNHLGSDVVTDSYTSATFVNKNVASGKTVNVNGISISGTDAGNYTFNTTATTTADITPRPLTVSAAGVSRVYDGTTAATVTLSDNRVSGDVFTDSYTSATFVNKNVATGKTVNVSGISISGTDAGNCTFNSTASTTANITPLAITGSITGVSRVYD